MNKTSRTSSRLLRRTTAVLAAVAVAAAAGLTAAAPAQALTGQTDAPKGRYPYFVQFAADRCGGALVDPEWVLTSKQCITTQTVGNQVFVGYTRYDEAAPITSVAREVRVQENTSQLALVRIDRVANATVLPLLNQKVAVGSTFTQLGGGNGGAGRLGTLAMKVTQSSQFDFTASSVSGKGHTCDNDAGGPAIVESPYGDSLVGVNWGSSADACTDAYSGFSTASRLDGPGTWAWLTSTVPSIDFAASHPGRYELVNVNSGKLLDIKWGSRSNGGEAIQYERTGGPNQQWTFRSDQGRVELVNYLSGLVLGVYGGSTGAGAPAIQWNAIGVPDQYWTVQRGADDTYTFTNSNSTQRLAIGQALKTDEAGALQYPDNGGAEQRWRIVKVG